MSRDPSATLTDDEIALGILSKAKVKLPNQNNKSVNINVSVVTTIFLSKPF